MRLNRGLQKESIFHSLHPIAFGKWDWRWKKWKADKNQTTVGGPLLWVGSGDLHSSLEHKIKWSSWSLNQSQILEGKQSFGKCHCTFPTSYLFSWVCGCVNSCGGVGGWAGGELYTGLSIKGTNTTTPPCLSFSLTALQLQIQAAPNKCTISQAYPRAPLGASLCVRHGTVKYNNMCWAFNIYNKPPVHADEKTGIWRG